MGAYNDSLANLVEALKSGMPGTVGLDFLGQLQQEQAAKRQARREAQAAQMEAQQAALGGLGTTAISEAQQGTSLDSLLKILSAEAQVSGLGSLPSQTLLQATPGLGDLYFTDTDMLNYGMSRVAPSLPSADASEIKTIYDSEYGETQRTQAARDAVHMAYSRAYGPKVYAALRPQIDWILDKF